MPRHEPTTRAQWIERMRRRLEQQGWPRLQMLFIVVLTGAAGFAASVALLHLGVRAMALRYALACLVAYVVFLGLLWLWMRLRAHDWLDLPDVIPKPDQAIGTDRPIPDGDAEGATPIESGSTDSGDGFGAADEAAIPLLLIVIVGAVLLAVLFVVVSAPVLFAELIVDGVLATGLYRRLRRIDARHWLDSALRRTAWPFVATIVLAAAAGGVLQVFAPGAITLGQALAQLGH